MHNDNRMTQVLEAIGSHLDIPRSYYLRAAERHKSVGEWYCRKESQIRAFNPVVSIQGSFRFGTVNRPLDSDDEYDLDNVTTLQISKSRMSQKAVKELLGLEMKAYAEAHGIAIPIEEHNRCWRVRYSDEVSFHLDSLPCVPETRQIIEIVKGRAVPPALADLAVAITDRRDTHYSVISPVWPSSNPRGFAQWFEEKARPFAAARIRKLVESLSYASVEEVPSFEWKTSLQRAIQLMKRHRDVMFRDDPSSAPISMIITNLAARAYEGEPDVYLTLKNIAQKMATFVNAEIPRVPNPADPAEDYADKWKYNSILEDSFWLWLKQLRTDIDRLPTFTAAENLPAEVRRIFEVDLTTDEVKRLTNGHSGPPQILVRSTAPIVIPSAPRPWGDDV
jgi:hypothetical protein